jgi:putative transport protein
MINWLVATLRSDPELLILISITWGFAASQVAAFNLWNVVVVLLAAVVIGKLGVIVFGSIMSTFLVLLLFAIGYGLGALRILIDRQREARVHKNHSVRHEGR